MAFMSLNGIDVSYDKKKQILKGLNLEVEEGELVSLLGPSGCGKSTTLRVVAGFIDPQGGTFTLDGEDMTKVPVHKRQFGLVFQSYALFPHMSLGENVGYGAVDDAGFFAFTFSKVSDDVDELANSAIPLSESEYEELEPGGGDESVAILLSVGGYTKGERALIGAIGDAAMVQEKCTINDALYWLVKALDGHRYVIMANDTGSSLMPHEPLPQWLGSDTRSSRSIPSLPWGVTP